LIALVCLEDEGRRENGVVWVRGVMLKLERTRWKNLAQKSWFIESRPMQAAKQKAERKAKSEKKEWKKEGLQKLSRLAQV